MTIRKQRLCWPDQGIPSPPCTTPQSKWLCICGRSILHIPLCSGKSRWSEDGRVKGQAKAEAIKLMSCSSVSASMHAPGTAELCCSCGKGTPASGKGNKRREQEEREQEKGTSGKGNAVCEADSTSQLSSKVLAVFHSLHHLGQHHQRPPRCRALSVPPSRDGKVISSPASAAFLTQGSCSFTMPVLVEGKADTMALLRPVSRDISCQHEPVTSLTAPRVTVSLSSGPCSDGSSSHGAWH